jgi:hypothetical protein
MMTSPIATMHPVTNMPKTRRVPKVSCFKLEVSSARSIFYIIMSPQEQSSVSDDESQYVFVIRHGDRWDYMHPEWLETASRKGDPPLSTLGHQQARETGIFLDSLLAHEGFTADSIIWLASPFLRTLQTSDDALNAFTKIDSSNISILPEYSVFEMDGHNGRLHKDLPTMEERKHYFPRLDESYASLFVPALPGKSAYR